MGKRQDIKVRILYNDYPLSIEPEKEEAVRKAVDRINADINECLDKYQISQQEALIMVLLQLQCRLIDVEERNDGEYAEARRDLEAITGKLEEYLHGRQSDNRRNQH